MTARISNTVLIAASIVLALILLEILVRVLDVPPRPLAPLPVPSYRLSENPVLKYEYRPGYSPEDEPYDASHKGYAINSAGFRDYEYEVAKPDGTFRIIVLGDSTTAGNGIPDVDRTYPKQLEKLLNVENQSGKHYEVLNFGVGGYHTMQEVETLKVKGLEYSPDLVLLTFCMNDLDLNADGKVAKRLNKVNLLSGEEVGAKLYSALLRYSRLAFIVHHRLKLSRHITRQDEWYVTDVLKGRSIARAGFELLAKLQEEHGFRALVLILPGFNETFDKYRFADIHEQVLQAAEGLPGITVIDLLPMFAGLDNDGKRFTYDALHMNEYGHRSMAEILLPIIRENAGNAGNQGDPGLAVEHGVAVNTGSRVLQSGSVSP
jgi:lysophospholipase L1-like esterase